MRNPLEVAYSLRERNGSSYSFGLRLWEMYNRRLREAIDPQQRIVTRYDSFFENPATELRRIATFTGLPLSRIEDAAALVNKNRRHTHSTIEQMIDARVAPEIIELYRELTAEANGVAGESNQAASASATDLIPGSISRLRGSDIELRRHVEELAQRDGRITELVLHMQRQEQTRTGLEEKLRHSAVSAARLEERQARLHEQLNSVRIEMQQIRDRFIQTSDLLQTKSISLAENETRVVELTDNLRRQLRATKKLSRLLDDLVSAAARLRSSRRWRIANPIGALKKPAFFKAPLAGYGHIEKDRSAYGRWRSENSDVNKVDAAIHALAWGSISTVLADGPPAARLEPRAPTEPITFAFHERIEVSIIIPVFNLVHFTRACLAALQRHAEAECFEVIVVDDGSTDATQELIEQIPGIVYVRNEENSGFIASCNRGANRSRGDFLVFLNNDTEVTPGWLRALRETFELEPRAGLVGSKLIFPDGRLQEAGGIIWRDATGLESRQDRRSRKTRIQFSSRSRLLLRRVFDDSEIAL